MTHQADDVDIMDPNDPNDSYSTPKTIVMNSVYVGEGTPVDAQIAALNGSAPVIDGDVDFTWSAANAQAINTIRGGGENLDGPGDCYGSWQGLWDADNLYLLVDITDANLVQDSGSGWDDDRLGCMDGWF